MARYYVNPNAQGDGTHAVHKTGCTWLRRTKDPEYLGTFPTCKSAIKEARKVYPTANGRHYCSNDCHSI